MLAQYTALRVEQQCHLLLAQPDCVTLKLYVQLYRTIGSVVQDDLATTSAGNRRGILVLFYQVMSPLVRHHLPPHVRRQLSKRLSLIHISEPTRLGMISYAVFCLKKKKKRKQKKQNIE